MASDRVCLCKPCRIRTRTMNELLRLDDEICPFIRSTLPDRIKLIKRFIQDLPQNARRTKEHIQILYGMLADLHQYICEHTKVHKKFPLTQDLLLLLSRYVEFEFDVLYLGKYYTKEYQEQVETRILNLLLLILNDSYKKKRVPNHVDEDAINALYVLQCVKLEYRQEHNLIENLTRKLLQKLNVLDTINEIKQHTGVYCPQRASKEIPEMEHISRCLRKLKFVREDVHTSDDETEDDYGDDIGTNFDTCNYNVQNRTISLFGFEETEYNYFVSQDNVRTSTVNVLTGSNISDKCNYNLNYTTSSSDQNIVYISDDDDGDVEIIETNSASIPMIDLTSVERVGGIAIKEDPELPVLQCQHTNFNSVLSTWSTNNSENRLDVVDHIKNNRSYPSVDISNASDREVNTISVRGDLTDEATQDVNATSHKENEVCITIATHEEPPEREQAADPEKVVGDSSNFVIQEEQIDTTSTRDDTSTCDANQVLEQDPISDHSLSSTTVQQEELTIEGGTVVAANSEKVPALCDTDRENVDSQNENTHYPDHTETSNSNVVNSDFPPRRLTNEVIEEINAEPEKEHECFHDTEAVNISPILEEPCSAIEATVETEEAVEIRITVCEHVDHLHSDKEREKLISQRETEPCSAIEASVENEEAVEIPITVCEHVDHLNSDKEREKLISQRETEPCSAIEASVENEEAAEIPIMAGELVVDQLDSVKDNENLILKKNEDSHTIQPLEHDAIESQDPIPQEEEEFAKTCDLESDHEDNSQSKEVEVLEEPRLTPEFSRASNININCATNDDEVIEDVNTNSLYKATPNNLSEDVNLQCFKKENEDFVDEEGVNDAHVGTQDHEDATEVVHDTCEDTSNLYPQNVEDNIDSGLVDNTNTCDHIKSCEQDAVETHTRQREENTSLNINHEVPCHNEDDLTTTERQDGEIDTVPVTQHSEIEPILCESETPAETHLSTLPVGIVDKYATILNDNEFGVGHISVPEILLRRNRKHLIQEIASNQLSQSIIEQLERAIEDSAAPQSTDVMENNSSVEEAVDAGCSVKELEEMASVVENARTNTEQELCDAVIDQSVREDPELETDAVMVHDASESNHDVTVPPLSTYFAHVEYSRTVAQSSINDTGAESETEHFQTVGFECVEETVVESQEIIIKPSLVNDVAVESETEQFQTDELECVEETVITESQEIFINNEDTTFNLELQSYDAEKTPEVQSEVVVGNEIVSSPPQEVQSENFTQASVQVVEQITAEHKIVSSSLELGRIVQESVQRDLVVQFRDVRANDYACKEAVVELNPTLTDFSNMEILAAAAAKQKKMLSINIKKEKRGRKPKGLGKKTATIAERRVTRNSAISKLTVESVDGAKCVPSTFMNLENLVTPPPICVYNLISNTITDNEESTDEPFNSVANLQDILVKNIAFDEDTVDDGITLISQKKIENKEIFISIPESEKDHPSIDYDILQQAEEFANTNLSLSTSDELCKELKLTKTKNVEIVLNIDTQTSPQDETQLHMKISLPQNRENVMTHSMPLKKRTKYGKNSSHDKFEIEAADPSTSNIIEEVVDTTPESVQLNQRFEDIVEPAPESLEIRTSETTLSNIKSSPDWNGAAAECQTQQFVETPLREDKPESRRVLTKAALKCFHIPYVKLFSCNDAKKDSKIKKDLRRAKSQEGDLKREITNFRSLSESKQKSVEPQEIKHDPTDCTAQNKTDCENERLKPESEEKQQETQVYAKISKRRTSSRLLNDTVTKVALQRRKTRSTHKNKQKSKDEIPTQSLSNQDAKISEDVQSTKKEEPDINLNKNSRRNSQTDHKLDETTTQDIVNSQLVATELQCETPNALSIETGLDCKLKARSIKKNDRKQKASKKGQKIERCKTQENSEENIDLKNRNKEEVSDVTNEDSDSTKEKSEVEQAPYLVVKLMKDSTQKNERNEESDGAKQMKVKKTNEEKKCRTTSANETYHCMEAATPNDSSKCKFESKASKSRSLKNNTNEHGKDGKIKKDKKSKTSKGFKMEVGDSKVQEELKTIEKSELEESNKRERSKSKNSKGKGLMMEETNIFKASQEKKNKSVKEHRSRKDSKVKKVDAEKHESDVTVVRESKNEKKKVLKEKTYPLKRSLRSSSSSLNAEHSDVKKNVSEKNESTPFQSEATNEHVENKNKKQFIQKELNVKLQKLEPYISVKKCDETSEGIKKDEATTKSSNDESKSKSKVKSPENNRERKAKTKVAKISEKREDSSVDIAQSHGLDCKIATSVNLKNECVEKTGADIKKKHSGKSKTSSSKEKRKRAPSVSNDDLMTDSDITLPNIESETSNTEEMTAANAKDNVQQDIEPKTASTETSTISEPKLVIQHEKPLSAAEFQLISETTEDEQKPNKTVECDNASELDATAQICATPVCETNPDLVITNEESVSKLNEIRQNSQSETKTDVKLQNDCEKVASADETISNKVDNVAQVEVADTHMEIKIIEQPVIDVSEHLNPTPEEIQSAEKATDDNGTIQHNLNTDKTLTEHTELENTLDVASTTQAPSDIECNDATSNNMEVSTIESSATLADIDSAQSTAEKSEENKAKINAFDTVRQEETTEPQCKSVDQNTNAKDIVGIANLQEHSESIVDCSTAVSAHDGEIVEDAPLAASIRTIDINTESQSFPKCPDSVEQLNASDQNESHESKTMELSMEKIEVDTSRSEEEIDSKSKNTEVCDVIKDWEDSENISSARCDVQIPSSKNRTGNLEKVVDAFDLVVEREESVMDQDNLKPVDGVAVQEPGLDFECNAKNAEAQPREDVDVKSKKRNISTENICRPKRSLRANSFKFSNAAHRKKEQKRKAKDLKLQLTQETAADLNLKPTEEEKDDNGKVSSVIKDCDSAQVDMQIHKESSENCPGLENEVLDSMSTLININEPYAEAQLSKVTNDKCSKPAKKKFFSIEHPQRPKRSLRTNAFKFLNVTRRSKEHKRKIKDLASHLTQEKNIELNLKTIAEEAAESQLKSDDKDAEVNIKDSGSSLDISGVQLDGQILKELSERVDGIANLDSMSTLLETDENNVEAQPRKDLEVNEVTNDNDKCSKSTTKHTQRPKRSLRTDLFKLLNSARRNKKHKRKVKDLASQLTQETINETTELNLKIIEEEAESQLKSDDKDAGVNIKDSSVVKDSESSLDISGVQLDGQILKELSENKIETNPAMDLKRVDGIAQEINLDSMSTVLQGDEKDAEAQLREDLEVKEVTNDKCSKSATKHTRRPKRSLRTDSFKLLDSARRSKEHTKKVKLITEEIDEAAENDSKAIESQLKSDDQNSEVNVQDSGILKDWENSQDIPGVQFDVQISEDDIEQCPGNLENKVIIAYDLEIEHEESVTDQGHCTPFATEEIVFNSNEPEHRPKKVDEREDGSSIKHDSTCDVLTEQTHELRLNANLIEGCSSELRKEKIQSDDPQSKLDFQDMDGQFDGGTLDHDIINGSDFVIEHEESIHEGVTSKLTTESECIEETTTFNTTSMVHLEKNEELQDDNEKSFNASDKTIVCETNEETLSNSKKDSLENEAKDGDEKNSDCAKMDKKVKQMKSLDANITRGDLQDKSDEAEEDVVLVSAENAAFPDYYEDNYVYESEVIIDRLFEKYSKKTQRTDTCSDPPRHNRKKLTSKDKRVTFSFELGSGNHTIDPFQNESGRTDEATHKFDGQSKTRKYDYEQSYKSFLTGKTIENVNNKDDSAMSLPENKPDLRTNRAQEKANTEVRTQKLIKDNERKLKKINEPKRKDSRCINIVIENLKNRKSQATVKVPPCRDESKAYENISTNDYCDSICQNVIKEEQIPPFTDSDKREGVESFFTNIELNSPETGLTEIDINSTEENVIFPYENTKDDSSLQIILSDNAIEIAPSLENSVQLLGVKDKHDGDTVTSTLCEDNIIAVMFSEQNHSSKHGFIFFKGSDYNSHSIGDPLVGGECNTNESDRTSDNKETVAPELDVLGSDTILPYLTDNHLNQESSEDNGADFQLLELIGNPLGRESSPPLTQAINCDHLYHTNLKRVEVECDELPTGNNGEFTKVNNEVYINQFQQQTMSVENMSDLMNVLNSIQNLNNMTKPTILQQDPDCKEIYLPPDLDFNVDLMQQSQPQNLDLSCDFSQAQDTTPESTISNTCIADYSNFHYVPVSYQSSNVSGSTKKVIVERIPQYYVEESGKEIPQQECVIEKPPESEVSCNKTKIQISKMKSPSPVTPKNPLNNVGFVRTSSKTKPSAPKPKKSTEYKTKEAEVNEAEIVPVKSKTVNDTPLFKNPILAATLGPPKGRSLPIIDDFCASDNAKSERTRIPVVAAKAVEEETAKNSHKSPAYAKSPRTPKPIECDTPDLSSQCDMIDNVKRRKRKPVDYSSIEKLLEIEELECRKQHKSKCKKDDKSKIKLKDEDTTKCKSKSKVSNEEAGASSVGAQPDASKQKNGNFEDYDVVLPKKKKSKFEPQLEQEAMNALFDKLVKEGNINSLTQATVQNKMSQEPPKPNSIFSLDSGAQKKSETTPVKQIGVVNPIPRQSSNVRKEPTRNSYGSDESRTSTEYYAERIRRSYPYSSRESNRSIHQGSNRRTEYSSHSNDQRYSSQRSSRSSRSRSSRHHSNPRLNAEQHNYRYRSPNDLAWREDMKKKFPNMFRDEVLF